MSNFRVFFFFAQSVVPFLYVAYNLFSMHDQAFSFPFLAIDLLRRIPWKRHLVYFLNKTKKEGSQVARFVREGN